MTNIQPLERLYTVSEVIRITRLSRTTLYRMMGAGSFPKPIKIGVSKNAWRASVIAHWLKARPHAVINPDIATAQRPAS